MTPLYKSLKENGTSFYAFPGVSEDISAAYQNESYKMYFSKYVLLNFPKQETSIEPYRFDFDNSFKKSSNSTPPTNYSDAIVESLRNYIANQETVIRESRLNNNEYYYDTNELNTTTEKIFWKWCRKLNIIDFEPAVPSDEYFDNLAEFQSLNINDDEYFPEFLWKEREINDYNTISFYESGEAEYVSKLEIQLDSISNFREGDIVNIYNVGNSSIINNIDGDDISDVGTIDGLDIKILKILEPLIPGQGHRIIVDAETQLSGTQSETTGQARLIYQKLVQYIGEVNGVSNVQEANRSYTEVHAHIPDHTGQTPDILFRTTADNNYKPNMTFPIIPSQYQPEILGAEFFNSPIVNNPNGYPGSYYGQFDTLDFTYKTETGDILRRSGNYYGVKGDINNIQINGGTIDGIKLDFDTNHYVKMNIPGRIVTNFDQFNALQVNNEPPKDFEFNAILWYYTVEDNNGNIQTNLYGISFLDNPNNNTNSEETSLRFPSIKKLVSNGNQDGTSYAFNLSLNFNIINENPIDTYNPEAINSMFSMNLFNDAMAKLSSTNDSFLNILSEQSSIRDEINSLKGLIYTQTDLNTINEKITNLEFLLRLYSTNQIISSPSIEVNQIPGTPDRILLNNIDTNYVKVDNINATELYSENGITPINILVPKNKNFLVNIINDDDVDLELEQGEKLTIVLDKDLYLNQSMDINITGTVDSSDNKKLDIYMISDAGAIDGLESEILLIGDIDLPVFYNTETQISNSAYLWQDFNFKIDFNNSIYLESKDRLKIPIEGNTYIMNNSIKAGDTLYLNNFFVGTSSVYNYSGQYKVYSLDGPTSQYITLDISKNSEFVGNYENEDFPYMIHEYYTTMLSNTPYFSLNKGMNIKVTRVSDSIILKERYQLVYTYLN